MTEEQASDFFRRYDEGLEYLLQAFFERRPGTTFYWPVVKAARLTKIWLDFGLSHVVRDEKGMYEVTDRLLNNIAMLQASTELLGRTQRDPRAVAEDAGHTLTDDDMDAMGDYFTDSRGQWYLSDYGLPRLVQLYGPLYSAESPEDQLYAADRILNVIHRRSDLAAMFVEGGTPTLVRISQQGGYTSNV